MKITMIHPSIGKIPGQKYIRAWQMEPLPVAQIASLTPKDIDFIFWDDRMEEIPYDKPTDLMIISVETYTAKRAYQIAWEYKKRNVKVVMGGFHTTLCPDEVSQHADVILIGEAENVWENIILDFKNNKLKQKYYGTVCDFGNNIIPDRTVYEGKNYLKITLLESGRGCRFKCEFCSIHNFFKGEHNFRKIETVVKEIKQLKSKKRLYFFVDDNIVANQEYAIKLFTALIPLKINWVGQADITIARNTELMKLMVKSGCKGVLIGFESLSSENLKVMKKNILSGVEEIEKAIKLIHKMGLRIYATFLFGYDHDKLEDFDLVLKFCIRNKLFMVGFNHLTPFPGTQLYKRLEQENKLRYQKWWLNENYTYGQIPFASKIDPDIIENECRRIRRKFYGTKSLLYRMTNITNINSVVMFPMYLSINSLLRKDTLQRKKFPLGDLGFDDAGLEY